MSGSDQGTAHMLTLYSLEARLLTPMGNKGKWYELAPGPDDGRHMAKDAAFFWIDEWETVAEPLLAERLPGYDRHGRINVPASSWAAPLAYLDDVRRRIESTEEAAEVHVVGSDLPKPVLNRLQRLHPLGTRQLAQDLQALSSWCALALHRWQSITVIGL